MGATTPGLLLIMPELLKRIEAVASELIACELVEPSCAIKAAHIAAAILLADDESEEGADEMFSEGPEGWTFTGPGRQGGNPRATVSGIASPTF